MTGKRPAPQRDGWLIAQAGNRWKAIRTQELTAWQLAYGCQSTVLADSRGELDMYLTAETIKDSMIDLAARLVDGIGEAAAKRRAEVTGQ